MDKPIKVILAIVLILCLANMPYGFYQFVRFAAMMGFAYFAYSANQQSNKNAMFVYMALAILFQPFIKVALGRTIWKSIDVITAVGMLLSITQKKEVK